MGVNRKKFLEALEVLERNGYVFSGTNLVAGRIVRVSRPVVVALLHSAGATLGKPGERGQLCAMRPEGR